MNRSGENMKTKGYRITLIDKYKEQAPVASEYVYGEDKLSALVGYLRKIYGIEIVEIKDVQ